MLHIGSPIEYLLESEYVKLGLPNGAAKHLLEIEDMAFLNKLDLLLCKYKDLFPTKLPIEYINRGV